jgi:hypothetical protein
VLPLDFKNLDKILFGILKSHPNRLGVYRILTHIYKIQEIPKIIFILNLDFRISSKRALNNRLTTEKVGLLFGVATRYQYSSPFATDSDQCVPFLSFF